MAMPSWPRPMLSGDDWKMPMQRRPNSCALILYTASAAPRDGYRFTNARKTWSTWSTACKKRAFRHSRIRFARLRTSADWLRLRSVARHPCLPDVGRFPRHPLAAFAPQKLDRVVVVDVTELALVDAVAA